MTYIPQINQAATTTQAKDTTTKSETLGQEDFLTLLVAQLQNQDPLNPSDPTEFTSQLAQFSELEQLFNLNDTMENLASAQNDAEKLNALSLIGKQVLVQGTSFTKREGSIEIGYRIEGAASDVTLLIQDEAGATVGRLRPSELDPGNHFITWNGFNNNGEPLPAGKYSILVQSQSSIEGREVTVSPLVHSTVTGVDLSTGTATLMTESGEFYINDIYGVYEQGYNAANNEEAPQNSEETISAATEGTEQTEEGSVVENVQDAVDTVAGTVDTLSND